MSERRPSRPASTAAAASIGNRPGSAPRRRNARCSSRLEQLIAPRHGGVHRLLTLGKIAWRRPSTAARPRRGGGADPRRSAPSSTAPPARARAAARRGAGRSPRPSAPFADVSRNRAARRGRVRRTVARPVSARDRPATVASALGVQRERPDGVFPLAAHAERGAAGRQHPQRCDRAQQIRDRAAPRPAPARSCRAPAASADPSHADARAPRQDRAP